MPDNPYKISEAELRASTGHAPGQELVETEPEVEVPHDLRLRVTPMSPVSEIYGYGQLAGARPERRRLARGAGIVLLGLVFAPMLIAIVRSLLAG